MILYLNYFQIEVILYLNLQTKIILKLVLEVYQKGDFTYPLNIFPIDIRSKKHIKKKTLPFINYHPDQILEKLKQYNFEIIEIRSVSNIRSTLLKRLFPVHTLIDLEKILQIPLAKFNLVHHSSYLLENG